ncbi:hypothetical protein BG015_010501 [Linnemannia schmuckeri]|uniref:Protein kinase domain-containing protein n=1 Tax=Linnemannia schmuckeri TaxID=64567 RepID=A0A9P5V914_9FUNG|nr:hypothetical protein BG015_010501 [Linnemannia schmuckeri]
MIMKIFNDENAEIWLQEVQGYEKISKPGHPNILRYCGGFYYCGQWCIVLDLAGMTPRQLKKADRNWMLKHHIQCLARDIFQELNYVHNMGVVNRDSKPENTLLTASWGALVPDLGMSDAVDETELAIGDMGTGEFKAPEIEGSYTISYSSDCMSRRDGWYRWAFGVIDSSLLEVSVTKLGQG